MTVERLTSMLRQDGSWQIACHAFLGVYIRYNAKGNYKLQKRKKKVKWLGGITKFGIPQCITCVKKKKSTASSAKAVLWHCTDV